jgi:cob(I)alamin adenosyltransferase
LRFGRCGEAGKWALSSSSKAPGKLANGERSPHSATASPGARWAKVSPKVTQDRDRDVAAAEAAWTTAKEMMADPDIRMLVLDELNVALRYDYLPIGEVVAALNGRRPDLHVVVTGRNAKPELLAAADLVTEMGAAKHYFATGVRAPAGIEF